MTLFLTFQITKKIIIIFKPLYIQQKNCITKTFKNLKN